MDEETRRKHIRRSIIHLIIASIILNILITATFLTSSPNISPASGWLMAVNKLEYRTGIKSKTDLKTIHTNASKISKEECMACHGSMKDSKLPLHRIHLTAHLVKFSCHDCHEKISLEKRSNERVVRLVDVGFCQKCHSEFSGNKPNSAMKPVDFQADCTLCHSGKHAFRHAQEYLSQIMSPRDCKGCHGGRVLPWRQEHTRDDWVQKHGTLALEDGGKCMSCHEYGLNFCQKCHSQKPASHKPRDAWLDHHKLKAKSDTRACLTCHKTDFCKKCHLGHTADWRQTHYKMVLSEGQQMCWNCHSQVFCSSCHPDWQKNIPQIGGGR